MNYGYSSEDNFGLGDGLGFKIKMPKIKIKVNPSKLTKNITSVATKVLPVVNPIAGIALNSIQSLTAKQPKAQEQVVEAAPPAIPAIPVDAPALPAPSGAPAMAPSAMAPAVAGKGMFGLPKEMEKYLPWAVGGVVALLVLPKLLGGGQPVILRANPRRRR